MTLIENSLTNQKYDIIMIMNQNYEIEIIYEMKSQNYDNYDKRSRLM